MKFRRNETLIALAHRVIAHGLLATGATSFCEMRRDRVPAIRIVSYHRTDPRHAGNLEKHFRFFSKYYLPATWNDLTAQISGTCPWTKAKPGIIVAFDDGGLSNFTVARPLLRRFGLTGIFLIPTDWIDTPREKQPEYAKAHRIVVTTRGVEAGLAMNWEQIRQLSLEKDKIVSHTRSHHRFSSLDTPKVLSREIKESKSILEERLHLPIDTFGWVGGESEVYQPAAFKQIQEAGYRYSLSTILGLNRPNTNPFFIRRTAIFDNWSLAQVRFWLLPISDRRYASKEARISRCLGISSSPVARS